MSERGHGHIVDVSSVAASGVFGGMTPYAGSKAGLSNFHRVLRTELRSSPPGLTIVEVGPVPSAMLDRLYRYPPTERGVRRLQRLHLMPELRRDRLARAVVDAVEHGRGAVRLPRRAVLFPVLASLPQRLIELMGVAGGR